MDLKKKRPLLKVLIFTEIWTKLDLFKVILKQSPFLPYIATKRVIGKIPSKIRFLKK